MLQTQTEISRVSSDWSALARRHDAVFQSPEFGMGWLQVAGPMVAARPAVAIARQRGRLVAVLPGCTTRRTGTRTLTWLGGAASVDRGAVLHGDCDVPREVVTAELVRAARRVCASMVLFPHVADDDPDRRVLTRTLAPLDHESAPFVAPEALDDPSFSRRLRGGHIRRLWSKMHAVGTVEIAEVERHHPRLDELFDRFVLLRRQRFTALGQRSPLSDDRMTDFYRDQIERNPCARFTVLLVDGELAAAQFGLETSQRFYGLVSAFDARLSACSPSTLMLQVVMLSTLAAGRVFDLGIGVEPYKTRWATGVTGLTTYVSRGPVPAAFKAVRRLRAAARPRTDLTSHREYTQATRSLSDRRCP